MAKLGDIATIQSGGTPARSIAEYWEDGTIPWVKISDIKSKHLNQTEEMITEAGLENSSAKIFPKGTILYTIFATLGETSILDINAATNQAIAGISITDSCVLPDYLYYYLLSQKIHVQKIGRGVAQNNINMKLLRDFDVPLPSKEAQLNIIEQLNRVTELLFLRKQQLTKLDELIKARFVEMFGTYPDNPFGWNTGKIQDVVSNVRYGSSRPAVEGGKYPYLRMNNITYAGELDLTDTKRIDVPDSELDKCTVQRGDVLFNRTNSKELVGKTCVYNRDDMMVLAGFVIRVRVNERILPEFLVAFLNTAFSKQMLLGMCKTAIGQANINAKEMQNIGLYIPPIALQEQFVDLKKQTDKSKLLAELFAQSTCILAGNRSK